MPTAYPLAKATADPRALANVSARRQVGLPGDLENIQVGTTLCLEDAQERALIISCRQKSFIGNRR